jgi:myosin XVIII
LSTELNEEQKIKAEYEMKILELENQKSMLKERIAELDFRLENTEDGSSVNMQNKRLELRIKELESKIDIDLTTKSRVDGQINRFKSEIEKLKTEISFLRAKDDQSQETLKKMKQKLQDLREQHQTMTYREQETNNKFKDMEKRMNDSNQKLQSDLRFAQQRIADLQMAIENETDVVSER